MKLDERRGCHGNYLFHSRKIWECKIMLGWEIAKDDECLLLS